MSSVKEEPESASADASSIPHSLCQPTITAGKGKIDLKESDLQ